jgi:hypothetical protein
MNTENIIRELNPIDYVIEDKKITLLFNDNKILILSDLEDKIMYSFFIDREHLSSNVEYEDIFIMNFKKYLET